MNYSQNLNREKIGKRMIISWVIVAIVFLIIGMFAGYTLKTHISPNEHDSDNEQTTESTDREFIVYGAYDEKIINDEIDLDWQTGDKDFHTFDVKMILTDQEYLFYLCKGYDLDYSLMMAVINIESNFDSSLISNTNDYGLMQINKANHQELTKILGVTDYLNPHQNMRAGCYVFRKLFEKYQQPNLVLMAYNMGEEGARRLWKEGIYETQYTQKVFSAQSELQQEE